MSLADMPFLPGKMPAHRGPLARFYPPIPQGAATAWAEQKVKTGDWILDPFGTSPSLALELARSGYRILVAANNPITHFVIEALASAPRPENFRAALADLASLKKGEERLDHFIQSIYEVDCPNCKQLVQAKAFIWQRQAESPEHCLMDCPHCGLSGEQPVSPSSQARLAALLLHGSHSRARALERVAPLDDPIRPDVDQALQCYLSRPLYVIFTLLNAIERLPENSDRQYWLTALLLSVVDEGNTLWPYPNVRSRPRQLVLPTTFKENNLWLALEEAPADWQLLDAPVAVARWPELPPPGGGICLYQGRARDLISGLSGRQGIQLADLPVAAMATVFPRPNQAFWTLSALWSGWLWGRESVKPLKNALARQRYDWNWHTSALTATLSHLSAHSGLNAPFWGLMAEVEPAFLSAAFIAADTAGLNFEGFALRHDLDQAEFLWSLVGQPTPSAGTGGASIEVKAILSHLEKRGEAAPYPVLHAAAAADLARSHAFRRWQVQKEQTVLQEHQAALQKIFNDPDSPLLRYGGGQHSIESALYWGKNQAHSSTPLSDLIEKEIVHYSLTHLETRLEDLDPYLCQVFPGLLTPTLGLIIACLESYAEQRPAGSGIWQIRPNELPALRKAELISILELLQKTGEQLNYRTQGVSPLQWIDADGKIAYEFYSMASAMITRYVILSRRPESRAIFVLPGSRSNLILYKLHHDPWLNNEVASGWTFLKFRHLRQITSSLLLSRPVWEEWLPRDPLELKATQLEMF